MSDAIQEVAAAWRATLTTPLYGDAIDAELAKLIRLTIKVVADEYCLMSLTDADMECIASEMRDEIRG